VVKLLSKRWWILYSSERLKLKHEWPRAEVGFPTTDQGFSSIQSTLFDFCGICTVFDAWILASKTVPDLNCEVHDLLLEVVDLE